MSLMGSAHTLPLYSSFTFPSSRNRPHHRHFPLPRRHQPPTSTRWHAQAVNLSPLSVAASLPTDSSCYHAFFFCLPLLPRHQYRRPLAQVRRRRRIRGRRPPRTTISFVIRVQPIRVHRSSVPLSLLRCPPPPRPIHCIDNKAPPFLSHAIGEADIQEEMLTRGRFRSGLKIMSCSRVNENGRVDGIGNGDLRAFPVILSCRLSNSMLHSYSLFGKVVDFRANSFDLRNFRRLCDVSRSDAGSDEDEEDDRDQRSAGDVNCVDKGEVDRICKLINESFTLDRNMEAVLDDCGINLNVDLVIVVLNRFCRTRKPAFRFFLWAGQRPGFSHDSRTYNVMMDILGRSRQFETMVSLLEEMGEKGTLSMETFVIAIRAFAAAKERKKAVGIFDLMKRYKFKIGVDTINCLLDALGQVKLGKEAQVIFERLEERFTPNMKTYAVLLNGWCRMKNLMEAGRVWNEMVDHGFKPDVITHNTMLDGLLKSKRRSDAIKLFEVMKAKGPSPNVRSYTILIRDFCKQVKMKEATEYFDEMTGLGLQPDAAVYTCLITGFGNQKRMDVVYELLKEMKEKGCPPDGKTYNALIKLLTSRNMPEDAVRVYNTMIQIGMEPSIHTYNMIMKSFFRIKDFDMGRSVWKEMGQKGMCPDDNSYTVFINGLISQGRSEEGCKYLEEMLEKGMKAPQLDYNKFAADFSRAGKPDILAELSLKMKFSGKFEVANVLSRWDEMMKKRVKRRDTLL